MPFTTTCFNSSMAVKKKPSRSNNTHDLALVKAAAWAWYQRGSGSQGKPIGEFDAARAHRVVYKPSRYKLEAMKISEEQVDEADNNTSSNNNISLLDRYEIQSISKRFDQLINSSTATKLLNTNTNTDDGMMTMNKQKAKKSIGFWRRHAVVCGTRQDAVVEDARLYGFTRRRRPDKRAPVVKLAACRPRLAHD